MDHDDRLYVLSLRFDGVDDFDSYLLVADGPSALIRPVIVSGSIVAVDDWPLLPKILDLAPDEFSALGDIPSETQATIDISVVVERVGAGGRDDGAAVLTFINVYLDLLKAIGTSLPKAKRRTLFALADHLTFEPDISSAYTGKVVSRSQALDAVYWLYGAVTCRMRVYYSDLFKRVVTVG